MKKIQSSLEKGTVWKWKSSGAGVWEGKEFSLIWKKKAIELFKSLMIHS